ncbi:MAG: LLM class flavin-dependent oxidoreductase [Terriglobales bacterium]
MFSTSPQSSGVERADYVARVIEVARWSEAAGCEGILVYTDNSLVDPWLVAQIIIQNTSRLSPLVAIQPAYMHPYAVAKMVSSLGHLYGRKIYLNMVAGGFTNDLAALNDTTPHDKRYARLVEYTTIIQELLKSPAAVNYRGEFYVVDKLRMTPPLPVELAPEVFVSGSSPAGLAAAQALGATAVKYPQPAEQEPDCHAAALKTGVRVGIIARQSEEEAWSVANERFPGDRKGQITHQLAMKTSDSAWHKQLSQMATAPGGDDSPYWLWPFENYKTFCPYLVGSYDRVAAELAKYFELGHLTFILDIPAAQDELQHISVVFANARQLVAK